MLSEADNYKLDRYPKRFLRQYDGDRRLWRPISMCGDRRALIDAFETVNEVTVETVNEVTDDPELSPRGENS